MLEIPKTINCRGKILSFDVPKVMGIINVTPDSFFEGSRFQNFEAIQLKVENMIEEGVDLIDIGGMSSRPGAKIIDENEEFDRVIPVIEKLNLQYPELIISIDTVSAKIAEGAFRVGASIINDISAGKMDERMYTVLSNLKIPYVLMHMQGQPADMQRTPQYENVVQEILDFFILELGKLRALGIKDVIVDPGFGFGKTVEHNYCLLKNMQIFQILDCPVLAGVSRKSMINKVLNINAKEALNGTTALHMVALQQGAQILRTHDVKEAKETIKLWQALVNA